MYWQKLASEFSQSQILPGLLFIIHCHDFVLSQGTLFFKMISKYSTFQLEESIDALTLTYTYRQRYILPHVLLMYVLSLNTPEQWKDFHV